MSYYPNYYTANPYSSGYNMQVPPQPQMFQQQSMINGKIVDSMDIVKVTEVPVGGYGVFPRADMGEVYIKTWGQDGTTQIITYKPSPTPQPVPAQDINSQLLERLDALETKLDSILKTTISEKEVKRDEQSISTTTNPVTSKF